MGNTSNKPIEITAEWNVSFTVECPHCEHDNDLMDTDEWWCTYGNIGETRTGLTAHETCSKCDKEFIVTGSQY